MFKSPLARSVATLLLLLALVSPVGALTVTTLDCSIPTVTSSIAIGVTQVEWLFTLDVNPSSGSILPRSVYLTAPVAWTFSYTALGTQYPVVANALMRIDLTAASTTFFVTGASSSTLSLYATPIGPTVSATAVSGATIDASVIGGTSPAAGTFTTVGATAAGGAVLGTNVATGTTNIPGFLKMWSNGDNAFFSSFTAATQTASAAYTLPTAPATVAGQVLTDAAANGTLSWATPSGRITVPGTASTYAGVTVTMTSTETQALGDAVQIDSAGKCHLAKADSLAHASAILIAVAPVTGSASCTYAMPGSIVKLAASASWTAAAGQAPVSESGSLHKPRGRGRPS